MDGLHTSLSECGCTVHSANVVEELYENERWMPLKGWVATQRSGGNIALFNRPHWSSEDGQETREKFDTLPPGDWHWVTQWRVWKSREECDEEGWQYALDFSRSYTARMYPTSIVRRRRWVRTRVGNPVKPVSSPPLMEQVLMCGWLNKLGNRKSMLAREAGWTRRYFILHDCHKLCYFKEPPPKNRIQKGQYQGVINLQGAKVGTTESADTLQLSCAFTELAEDPSFHPGQFLTIASPTRSSEQFGPGSPSDIDFSPPPSPSLTSKEDPKAEDNNLALLQNAVRRLHVERSDQLHKEEDEWEHVDSTDTATKSRSRASTQGHVLEPMPEDSDEQRTATPSPVEEQHSWPIVVVALDRTWHLRCDSQEAQMRWLASLQVRVPGARAKAKLSVTVQTPKEKDKDKREWELIPQPSFAPRRSSYNRRISEPSLSEDAAEATALHLHQEGDREEPKAGWQAWRREQRKEKAVGMRMSKSSGVDVTVPKKGISQRAISSSNFIRKRSSSGFMRGLRTRKVSAADKDMVPSMRELHKLLSGSHPKRLKRYCRSGVHPPYRSTVWFRTSGAQRLQDADPDLYAKARHKAFPGRRTLKDYPPGQCLSFSHSHSWKEMETPEGVLRTGILEGDEDGLDDSEEEDSEEVQAQQVRDQKVSDVEEILFVLADQFPSFRYCPFLPHILMVAMDYITVPDAYILSCELINRSMIDNWYLSLSTQHFAVFVHTFEDLMGLYCESVYAHLKTIGVNIPELVHAVFAEFFVCMFDNDQVARILDVFFNEGYKVLYRIALSIFRQFEPIILCCTQPQDVLSLIQLQTATPEDFASIIDIAFELPLLRRTIQQFQKCHLEDVSALNIDATPMRVLHWPEFTEKSSSIMSVRHVNYVWAELPERVQHSELRLLYSLKDGHSFKTFIHKVHHKGALLLAILDQCGGRFGCFLSTGLQVSNQPVQDPLSLAFRLSPGPIETFRWHGHSDDVDCDSGHCLPESMCNTDFGFSMGGGASHLIRLPADLTTGVGSCASCSVFRCHTPLSKAAADHPLGDFQFQQLEVWGFDDGMS